MEACLALALSVPGHEVGGAAALANPVPQYGSVCELLCSAFRIGGLLLPDSSRQKALLIGPLGHNLEAI